MCLSSHPWRISNKMEINTNLNNQPIPGQKNVQANCCEDPSEMNQSNHSLSTVKIAKTVRGCLYLWARHIPV